MAIEYRGASVPGGEVSPGSGSTGFTSRAVAFSDSAGRLTGDSTGLQYDSTQGFLGINTTAPAQRLDIVSTGATGPMIRLANASTFILGNALNNSLVVLSNSGGAMQLWSTSIIIGQNATSEKVGFYGVTGTTRPSSYTTGASTASRTVPTTITTGTQTTADVKAMQNAVNQIISVLNNLVGDLKGWGLSA